MHDDKAVIYQGTRVTLRAVALPGRDGGVINREVAEVADAVVILPVLDDEHLVLIRNERFAVGKTLLELPAGTIEPGEDPDVCAGRELEEETGYAADNIERLTAYYPTPGFCTEKLHAYRATGLTFHGQSLDENERITTQVLSWDQTMEKIRTGEIEDAKTIATVLFVRAFMKPSQV